MSESSKPFDYMDLNDHVVTLLKKNLTSIRSNSKSSTKAILNIGLNLLDARRHLEHGLFQTWVRTECGFCVRTAERYKRAAEVFEDEYDTVSHLQPSTIYRLSAKKMPVAIVDEVLLFLREGTLNDNDVNATIDRLLPVDNLNQNVSSPDIASTPLMTAWLEAAPPDRTTLLKSYRETFVVSAWDLLSTEERVTFVNGHSSELAGLLAAVPLGTPLASDAQVTDPVNVVHLFGPRDEHLVNANIQHA